MNCNTTHYRANSSSVPGDPTNAYAAGLVGFASDGWPVVVTPLFQIAANPVVMLLDPDTLRVQRLRAGAAEGAVQAAALSPDGRRLALVTSDGVLTVWDLATLTRVDRADPGLGPLVAVQWLDDQDLVVLGAAGDLSTVTTDAGRLLELARDGVTRGLSSAECASHGVSPCPSTAALRDAAPVVPDELRGTYALTWTADELREVLLGWATESFGNLDQVSVDRLAEQAELAAGTYRVEIREADYAITRGNAGQVWCSGSVTPGPSRPDRLLLGADDGDRCTDFHYVEVGWERQGDQLLLPHEKFRGSDLDALLWTTRPLRKVD